MSTKREPLLSDEQIIEEQEAWDGSIDGGELAKKHQTYTARWVRDTYEAARAKDAELIQQLVDALALLREVYQLATGTPSPVGDFVLDAADESGFKPSEQ